MAYAGVLAEMKSRIAAARQRALATVNSELVALYWEIGRVIVRQQEVANWGDAVVERLSADLRNAFPDMKGLSHDNMFRMRQFYLACREIGGWFRADGGGTKVGTLSRRLAFKTEQVGMLSRELYPPELGVLVLRLSWSHHYVILGGARAPSERYFYMAMTARERWSVRELRRQIDAALYARYVSVRREPEKCLPDKAERDDSLPFKDHYVLEFLGLAGEHSEQQLRKAVLHNLRDFFLEFGRDFTLVGEEYPLAVGAETFHIDLLFFHRRLRCLVAVELKIGGFKPEYIGKSLFYVAALDEQVRLRHEKPSVGLILCRNADRVQLRLALTDAAKKIGVATYQTAMPDEKLIRKRLEMLPKTSHAGSERKTGNTAGKSGRRDG
jgi:predicted nuclease of restriction endonuclease-like (RecB) superfamily